MKQGFFQLSRQTKIEETRAFNALNSKTTLETRDPKWQKKQTGLQARGGQSQALFIPVSEETEQHSSHINLLFRPLSAMRI